MKSIEFQFLNLTSQLTSGVSPSESNIVNFESLEIVKNENITIIILLNHFRPSTKNAKTMHDANTIVSLTEHA